MRNFTMGVSLSFRNLGLMIRYAWPSMCMAVLLPIPFISVFTGQVDALLHKVKELGYFPQATLRSLKPQIISQSKRNVLGDLISVLLNVLVIVLPPLDRFLMETNYSDQKPTFRFKGNNGSVFAFELLCFLFLVVVGVVAFIPLLVCIEVAMQAYDASQIGDPINLPVLFPLYAYLGYALSMAIFLTALMMVRTCRLLMWGSLSLSSLTSEEVLDSVQVEGE